MRKKASSQTWNTNLEPGATIEGQYVAIEKVEGKFGPTRKYIIKTKSGEYFGVFDSAILNRQFSSIPVGSYVWIEYKGKETSKNGFTVIVYDVEYDDEYQDQQ